MRTVTNSEFTCYSFKVVKFKKTKITTMKFTIAVVMLALAVSAQAALIPLTYSLPYGAPYAAPYAALPQYAAPQYQYAPLSYTARSLPLTYAAPTIQYEYAPTLQAYPELHTVAELRSPAAIIQAEPQGTYTAVNKGAIHVAPLPGHSQSASSINLESAPGTY